MSATTHIPSAAAAGVAIPPQAGGDGLWQVVRSEWTKFWSLRSTLWTLLALVVVTVGFAALFSWGFTANLANIPPEQLRTLDPTNITMGGLAFGQLAIAVLGVLIIAGEYSTGGIKASLTAVPQRLRLLLAKGIVFAAVALVIGFITCFAAFFVGMPFFTAKNLGVGLGDPGVLRAVIGGGLYVAGTGMFGFALGTLLRNSAGAITIGVALLLVVPLLTGLLPGSWGHTINHYFTSNAGQHVTEVVTAGKAMGPWTGYLAFSLEWVALMVAAAILMRRRDA